MKTLFSNAIKQLDSITVLLEIEYSDKKRFRRAIFLLKKPRRLLKRRLRIRLDGGATKSFQAFRSQHNDARGPFKGGIRFHQGVTGDEVKTLSFWMSVKCAVVNIPYGGGKGGITVEPKSLSSNELQRLCGKYAEFLAPYIGPWQDIPAPDVNTGEREMAWMLDAYEKKIGQHAPAAFTGKPISLGGSLGRTEATGLGGFYILKKYSQVTGTDPVKATVAIQGFGNVGYWFAKFAQDAGYKVVAVSDSSGGIYNPRGVDVDKLAKLKEQYRSFANIHKTKKLKLVTNEKLLILPVDFLVPAALENVITNKNAGKIKAKTIIELANGPTTPEAEKLLLKKKVKIIPDVLASAGGVIVSYFEWVQNLHGYRWTKDRINSELKIIMDKAFEEIHKTSRQKKISFRQAAYVIAVKKIVDAMILRGRV